MFIDLTGKKAVISASTAGIGLAIAKGLAASGAEIVINGRSRESVEQALSTIRQDNAVAKVTGFAGDLATPEMCAQLLAEHPDCDILVNNLGIYALQDFLDIDDAEWERFFQVNVMSGVRLARGYVQTMAEKGWGRVVFISSESALNIPPEMIHYGFSKTAQLAISRGLAKRMAGTGVTVNSILPGPTLSDGVASMLKDAAIAQDKTLEEVAAAFVQQHRPSSVIRRAATVEEVANMVVYVCSTQASATTGAALRVDGGVIDTIC
ncbi:SDR family oxidoreductase [Agrobacterium rhizogenes]|uniref:SDR family NAD(P)-dependent oxidoreductase n=1 Tax=Rhizobium rhizogenes TaxID=359 RepID=UPI0015718398|nr:SDR family oxidoreductase [Rhizobium rhizogenes]NTH16773.1 SDR family oxidoreductase [Rhizobium rhizogenes]